MKIRLGFVSNSSSSSFTCHVTGDTITCDQDGYWDRGFRSCQKGHGFPPEDTIIPDTPTAEQEEYLLDSYADIEEGSYVDLKEKIRKFYTEFDWDTDREYNDWLCEVPDWMCPICQMEKIGFVNAMRFMLKETYGSRKQLDKIIKTKFKTVEDLEKFVEGIELL